MNPQTRYHPAPNAQNRPTDDLRGFDLNALPTKKPLDQSARSGYNTGIGTGSPDRKEGIG